MFTPLSIIASLGKDKKRAVQKYYFSDSPFV
jgi:hypothetical protein